MIRIQSDPPILLILHPKTATRAIEKGVKDLQVPVKCVNGRHGVVPVLLNEWKGPVVGSIRNPFEMMLSWWTYSNRPGYRPLPDFATWLPKFMNGIVGGARRYVRPRTELFYGSPWMTDVIRYENGPEQELNRILASVGLPSLTLEHVGDEGVNRKEREQKWYTEEIATMVYEQYEKDFNKYNYPFESWKEF